MDQKIPKTQESESMQEIDLLDLLEYYLGHLPLLIAAIVLGAVLSGLFTRYAIPDRYTANSRMYMISASSDSVVNLSDLNIGASLSNDYAELMKSRPVMEEVINKLDLDYTYEQLVGMVDFSVVNNTRIIKISVTGTDPRETMQIANEIATTAKTQLPLVMDAPSPSIVEYAIEPSHKSSPSMSRNVMLGSFLFLAAVLALLTVRYLLDDTVKSAEDIENMFGAMPLSVIPEGEIKGGSNAREKAARSKSLKKGKKK